MELPQSISLDEVALLLGQRELTIYRQAVLIKQLQQRITEFESKQS